MANAWNAAVQREVDLAEAAAEAAVGSQTRNNPWASTPMGERVGETVSMTKGLPARPVPTAVVLRDVGGTVLQPSQSPIACAHTVNPAPHAIAALAPVRTPTTSCHTHPLTAPKPKPHMPPPPPAHSPPRRQPRSLVRFVPAVRDPRSKGPADPDPWIKRSADPCESGGGGGGGGGGDGGDDGSGGGGGGRNSSRADNFLSSVRFVAADGRALVKLQQVLRRRGLK